MKVYEKFERACVYGSMQTEDTAYIVAVNGGFWYCVDGSVNVNFTTEDIMDIGGVLDVEEISDTDFFTASEPIESLEELTTEVEEE